jgi:hypothetical protein
MDIPFPFLCRGLGCLECMARLANPRNGTMMHTVLVSSLKGCTLYATARFRKVRVMSYNARSLELVGWLCCGLGVSQLRCTKAVRCLVCGVTCLLPKDISVYQEGAGKEKAVS